MIVMKTKVLHSDARLLLVRLSVLLYFFRCWLPLSSNRIKALSHCSIASFRLVTRILQAWIKVNWISAHFIFFKFDRLLFKLLTITEIYLYFI
jgi:hypothetical protein